MKHLRASGKNPERVEIPIKIKSAAIVRPWKKWMAVGCSHAQLADPKALEASLLFKREFKPVVTIHAGDFTDSTAWRSGAKGSKDETEDIGDDVLFGLNYLEQLRPTTVFLGNHDVRGWEKLDHPNAIIRCAAESFVASITDFIREDLKADFVDHYDITKSWRQLGNLMVGHGFMFNESAIRDHAEYHGKSCLIAHLHRQGIEQARTARGATGYCMGYLGDPNLFNYANRHKAKSKWTRGWAYGEYCDDCTMVNLYDYESKCPRTEFHKL